MNSNDSINDDETDIKDDDQKMDIESSDYDQFIRHINNKGYKNYDTTYILYDDVIDIINKVKFDLDKQLTSSKKINKIDSNNYKIKNNGIFVNKMHRSLSRGSNIMNNKYNNNCKKRKSVMVIKQSRQNKLRNDFNGNDNIRIRARSTQLPNQQNNGLYNVSIQTNDSIYSQNY
mmetsp:Transcript_104499/g.127641  ORF Transcript_104499/g.127641 Transcript_104499/m.127641 type:complete len:174 (+) Transcript_104499:199-720(+)